MSKSRVIAFGTIGMFAAAGTALLVPASRHAVRHFVAAHTHVRFSTMTAKAVVPVTTEMPVGSADAASARPIYTPDLLANVPSSLTQRPSLDSAAFAPPTATAQHFAATQVQPGIEKVPPAPASAATGQDPVASVDLAGAKQALLLYRQGAYPAADDFAKMTDGPLRTLLDWAAIRLSSRAAGLPRMQAFAAAHPDWPARQWLDRRIEESRAGGHDPAAIRAMFADAAPETLGGKIALARADLASSDTDGAAKLVRGLWRDADLTPLEESAVLHEFSALLRREDHKYRADRLLYKEDLQPALRAAVLAGPDVAALAKARAAVVALAPSDTAIAAVPKTLRLDPGLIYSQIQKARRANKITEAAALMLAAPTDPALIVDGDAWWIERRLVARKLLDMGQAKQAYEICAAHVAASNPLQVEEAFHAGWIALRFLYDPALATPHFATAAKLAETPISLARAKYWQARAAQAAGDANAAATFFTAAADHPTTFYGQLAGNEIGKTAIELRQPTGTAGDDRRESIRVVALLFALGERDMALSLAQSIAKTDPDEGQVAALADVVAATQDARATLEVGKVASQRGIAVDEAAFPDFGIPAYRPLGDSADRSIVYAIARQESEFNPRSVSSAGAKGLMQLIDSTARQTAMKAGVDFNETRLLDDAAFNAQIGAAHLGRLLADEGGSYILTFAAYNAGPKKVQEWIETYGDPRKPGVDPVDWIERIPYTETRNYVQRVFENLQIYRTRFGMPTAMLTGQPERLAGKGT